MKQIVCEFSDHDLAEQAAHRCASRVILFWKRALKQRISGENASGRYGRSAHGFSSQPVPDGFVILHSENQTEPPRDGLHAPSFLSR